MKRERKHEMGEGGHCFCPKCSKKTPHNRGIPCQDEKCPECGTRMIREGSYHHELLEKKSKNKEES